MKSTLGYMVLVVILYLGVQGCPEPATQTTPTENASAARVKLEVMSLYVTNYDKNVAIANLEQLNGNYIQPIRNSSLSIGAREQANASVPAGQEPWPRDDEALNFSENWDAEFKLVPSNEFEAIAAVVYADMGWSVPYDWSSFVWTQENARNFADAFFGIIGELNQMGLVEIERAADGGESLARIRPIQFLYGRGESNQVTGISGMTYAGRLFTWINTEQVVLESDPYLLVRSTQPRCLGDEYAVFFNVHPKIHELMHHLNSGMIQYEHPCTTQEEFCALAPYGNYCMPCNDVVCGYCWNTFRQYFKFQIYPAD